MVATSNGICSRTEELSRRFKSGDVAPTTGAGRLCFGKLRPQFHLLDDGDKGPQEILVLSVWKRPFLIIRVTFPDITSAYYFLLYFSYHVGFLLS